MSQHTVKFQEGGAITVDLQGLHIFRPLGSYHFLPEGGRLWGEGTRIFWGSQRGEDQFLQRRQDSTAIDEGHSH